MGWTISVLGSGSRWGLGIFLLTAASRKALGPTQPPIQWVPGAISLVIKGPGREADHSPPSSAEVEECMALYLHSPNTPSWCGVQLKKAQGQLYLYLTYNRGDEGSNRTVPRRRRRRRRRRRSYYLSVFTVTNLTIFKCKSSAST
jgi:hypothetical protein